MLRLAAVHHIGSGIAGVVIGVFAIWAATSWGWNNSFVYRMWKGILGDRVGGVAGGLNRIGAAAIGAAMIALGVLAIFGVI